MKKINIESIESLCNSLLKELKSADVPIKDNQHVQNTIDAIDLILDSLKNARFVADIHETDVTFSEVARRQIYQQATIILANISAEESVYNCINNKDVGSLAKIAIAINEGATVTRGPNPEEYRSSKPKRDARTKPLPPASPLSDHTSLTNVSKPKR